MEVKSCGRPLGKWHKVVCDAPIELFTAALPYVKGISIEEYAGHEAIRLGTCLHCYMPIVRKGRRFELWNAPQGVDAFASIMTALGLIERVFESYGMKMLAEVPSKFWGEQFAVPIFSEVNKNRTEQLAAVAYGRYRNIGGYLGGYHTVIVFYLPTEIKTVASYHWSLRLVTEAMGYGLYVSGPHRYESDKDIVEYNGRLVPTSYNAERSDNIQHNRRRPT